MISLYELRQSEEFQALSPLEQDEVVKRYESRYGDGQPEAEVAPVEQADPDREVKWAELTASEEYSALTPDEKYTLRERFVDRFGDVPEESDFKRGVVTTFKQIPQLGRGLEAGLGAAGEKVFGEGGAWTNIKEAGVRGYQEASQDIQKDAKATDNLDFAWSEAKSGNPGALVDWLQYGLGYTVGQGAQILATGGAGAGLAKTVGREGVEKLASGLVKKEVARIAATEAGKSLAEKELLSMAVSNVATKIGQTTAMAGTAFGMEGGEIFGGLTSKAQQEGRDLTGGELAKAFGMSVTAGALEFVGDKLGLDVMLGKSPIFKGVKGRLGRAAIGAGAAAPIEAGTEWLQTQAETYGQGGEPFTDEANKEAFNAAALGGLGGAVIGGGGGLLSSEQEKPPEKSPAQIKQETEAKAQGILAAGSVDEAIGAFSASVESTTAELDKVAEDLTIAGREADQRDIMSDFAEGAVDVQGQADTRARQYKYDQLARSTPVTESISALAGQQMLTPAQREAELLGRDREKRAEAERMESERISGKQAELEQAFSDLTPEDLRNPIAEMEKQLATGETGIRFQKDDGTWDGVKSTNQPWIKNDALVKYDQVNGTSLAKRLNKGSFAGVMRNVRAGEELTSAQGEIWEYIQHVARTDKSPEVAAANEYNRIEQEGIELESPRKVVVASLNEGDKVVVHKNGIPDVVTVKGRDEDGSVVLEDGTRFALDDFDKLEISGIKRAEVAESEQMPPAISQPNLTNEVTKQGGDLSPTPATDKENLSVEDNAADSKPGAGKEYQPAGDKVSGLAVRPDVPNTSSVKASLNDYTVQDGIKEVPLSEFPGASAQSMFYSKDDFDRVDKLAEEIKSSGEINPLIVVIDKEGPYVLEGGHRLAALHKLGVSHVPAMVVVDNDSVSESGVPPAADSIPAPTKGEEKSSPDVSQGVLQSSKKEADLPSVDRQSEPSTKAAPARKVDNKPPKVDNVTPVRLSIEPHGKDKIIVKGDPDAIRAKLAESGIKAKGLVNKAKGGVVFPARMEGEIRGALTPPETEIIEPAKDKLLGENNFGEPIYERENGDRYRMRFDSPNTRPNGYPDFGGELATKEEFEQDKAEWEAANPDTVDPLEKGEKPVKFSQSGEVSLKVEGFRNFTTEKRDDGRNVFHGIAKVKNELYFFNIEITKNDKGELFAKFPKFETFTGKSVRGSANVILEDLMDVGIDAAIEYTKKNSQKLSQSPATGKPILTAEQVDATRKHRLFDVGFKGRPPQKLYRGVSESSGSNAFILGRGLYSTTDKKQASEYGAVSELDPVQSLPKNPLYFDNMQRFEEWRDDFRYKVLGVRRSSEVPVDLQDASIVARAIDLDIDGIQIGKGPGSFFVKFLDSKLSQSNSSGQSLPSLRIALLKSEYGARVSKLIEAGRLKLVQSASELPEGAKPLYMTARHKSPHEFDSFSTDKIGTGEGHQAFGHGLYFYTADEVGNHYDAMFSAMLKEKAFKLPPELVYALREEDYLGFDSVSEAAGAIYQHEDWKSRWETNENLQKLGDEWRRAAKDARKKAYTYEVELAPESDEYLLWDRPLSEQSEKVRKALEGLPEDVLHSVDVSGGDGSSLYRAVTNAIGRNGNKKILADLMQLAKDGKIPLRGNAEQKASEYLHSLGVRGIKYLDGTSRAKGEGAFNYVIFSDEDVSITARFSRGNQIGGAYLASNDTMYLVADGVTAGQEQPVLLHEALHRAKEQGKLQPFMSELSRMEARYKAGTPMAAWFDKARKAAQVDKGKPQYLEEIAAYAVQNYKESPNVIKRWVDRLIAQMRVWLSQTLGIRPGKLTPAVLREIAVQGLRTGKESLQVGEPTEEVRYSVGSAVQQVTASVREATGGKEFWEKVYTYLADRHFPIAKLMKGMAKRYDADYLEVERQRGKVTANAVRRFHDDRILPILKHLADSKLKIEDLEELAYVRHVPEANLRLRRIRAKNTLTSLKRQFTEAEWRPIQEEMDEIYNNTEKAGDIQDQYIDLIAKVESTIADRQAKADQMAAGLVGKTFDTIEAQARAEIMAENAQRRVEEQHKIFDSWNDTKDRLAGITDKEANDKQTEWKQDSRYAANMQAVKMMSAINKERLDILWRSGEIATEEYMAYNKAYKNYVPLYREGFDDKAAVGRGAGPLGKPVKLRAGSTKKVVDVFAHTVDNYRSALVRSEKMKAYKHLYNAVLLNPGQAWDIVEVPKKATLDADGNLTWYPDMKEADNELHIKIEGERKIIRVDENDKVMMEFVKAVKGQDAQLGPVLQWTYKVNRLLAALNTSWSPEFIISNFTRDIQTALVNMTGTEAENLHKRVLKRLPTSIKEIYRDEQKGVTSPVYREFAEYGGKMGWMDNYENVEKLGQNLEKEMQQFEPGHKGKKALLSLKKWIESTNTAVENGVRLSVYAELTGANGPKGMTKRRAANIASNLTVDFTRRGSGAPAINALWLFFNASVQGNVRMFKALSRSPKVRKVGYGIIAAGSINYLLGAMMAGDDDDGENYYDKLRRAEPSLFERNMVFMIPGSDGKYIKIPMPYLYNSLFLIGNELGAAAIAGVTDQKYDAGRGAAMIGKAFMNSVNPIQAATLMQTLAPTLLDPFVQIAENKNWFGGPVMPEKNPFGIQKPDSERYFKNVNPAMKWVAQAANELTGGDKVKPGLVDISPETLELVVDTLGGSTARFLKDTATMPVSIATGELETRKVPFVRRLYGQKEDYVDSKIYRESVAAVELLKEQGEAYPELRSEFAKNPKARMIPFTKSTESRLRKLNKKLRVAEARGNKVAIEQVKKQIHDIQIQYNLKYNEITGN